MSRNAEAIAEGEAIALAAARLQVKNRILVSTISVGSAFDVGAFVPVAREALERLAEESEQAAGTAATARKRAWGRHSQPHGTHDYRDRDVRNLRRRVKQSQGVAKRLRARLEDPDGLRVIVEDARDAAWHDVASNLDRRLTIEALRPDEDPDYERMREARMQALRLVDLQQLASQQRVKGMVGDDDAEAAAESSA